MRTILLSVLFIFLMVNMTFAGQYESDTFKTKDGHSLTISFIKHGSLSIAFQGKIIQIDPTGMFADYSKMPKADLILITHEHPDHLDTKAIVQLEKKTTVIVANPASGKIIGKGLTMKNGQTVSPLKGITIEAIPAYNTTPGREKYHPKGRDNGYILTLGGTKIYIAGDTEDITEMRNLHGIDIAFLPVNQPYTMTVDQAVKAAKMFHPHILYPYHYGETNVEPIKNALQAESIEVRIRLMQ